MRWTEASGPADAEGAASGHLRGEQPEVRTLGAWVCTAPGKIDGAAEECDGGRRTKCDGGEGLRDCGHLRLQRTW